MLLGIWVETVDIVPLSEPQIARKSSYWGKSENMGGPLRAENMGGVGSASTMLAADGNGAYVEETPMSLGLWKGGQVMVSIVERDFLVFFLPVPITQSPDSLLNGL